MESSRDIVELEFKKSNNRKFSIFEILKSSWIN